MTEKQQIRDMCSLFASKVLYRCFREKERSGIHDCCAIRSRCRIKRSHAWTLRSLARWRSMLP